MHKLHHNKAVYYHRTQRKPNKTRPPPHIPGQIPLGRTIDPGNDGTFCDSHEEDGPAGSVGVHQLQDVHPSLTHTHNRHEAHQCQLKTTGQHTASITDGNKFFPDTQHSWSMTRSTLTRSASNKLVEVQHFYSSQSAKTPAYQYSSAKSTSA